MCVYPRQTYSHSFIHLHYKCAFSIFINRQYICGNPDKQKPLTLKLLKKDLNWKLLIHPELYLGEEYFKHNINIENGTIYDFLCLCLKNIG